MALLVAGIRKAAWLVLTPRTEAPGDSQACLNNAAGPLWIPPLALRVRWIGMWELDHVWVGNH